MLATERRTPALLVICITFVLFCVEVVQNNQEKKETAIDGGKYSHKGYPLFQAQLNK